MDVMPIVQDLHARVELFAAIEGHVYGSKIKDMSTTLKE